MSRLKRRWLESGHTRLYQAILLHVILLFGSLRDGEACDLALKTLKIERKKAVDYRFSFMTSSQTPKYQYS